MLVLKRPARTCLPFGIACPHSFDTDCPDLPRTHPHIPDSLGIPIRSRLQNRIRRIGTERHPPEEEATECPCVASNSSCYLPDSSPRLDRELVDLEKNVEY